MAVIAPGYAQDRVVNVYNSRHYGTDEVLWKGFTDKTGIQVRVVEGSHDELIQRLATEGENTPADVLITVDAGRLAFAAGKGLFQPVSTPVLEASVPAHLRHPEGLWWGLAMRARIIVYARDRVAPSELRRYEDLADPKWRGRVLVRSSTNVYNISLVGAILAANGPEKTEEWCRGLVANLARPPQGGDTDQIEAVAAGVGDVAIVNSYYFARLAASNDPAQRAIVEKLGVIFPNQDDRGTHVNISGAAVTRHAPHRDHAIALLEYLVSPEAQRYFADVSLEYPVNPAVEPHPVLQGFGSFRQDTLNAARYAELADEAVRIMDRAGWR
jgi:iron(III) transport system substrate-binding protein